IAPLLCAGGAHAQQPDRGALDTLRSRDSFSPNDKDKIGRWVRDQVDALANLPADARPGSVRVARAVFDAEYNHASSSQPFRLAFAEQVGAVAVEAFGRADLDADAAHLLALLLLDLDRIEALDGLLAGLASKDARARLVCARGLGDRKTEIAAEPTQLSRVVAALRAAGLKEAQPVVLTRIYWALAYPAEVDAVFDAYIDLLGSRETYRRGPAIVADGAELGAYDFFRVGGVLAALNQGQQTRLVERLAFFFRLDAQRYNDPSLVPPTGDAVDLGFYERDALERMLLGNETILATLIRSRPAGISQILRSGGYAVRAPAILAQVYGWVGDPKTNTPGPLNAAPWDVAIGAP
ncbi:MAG: hypothetical protein IIB60_03760, partial [Planctomycetes bacterium]|nr:hypothetical protein [Planctomycetota bacterium]